MGTAARLIYDLSNCRSSWVPHQLHKDLWM